ncbi:MAG: H-NS histone family protein [Magnetococcales bacterium]|nr:H-NS histone family protein [Magnetococcales bacterium]MBF0173670.1 H-NS histone family protein [Magnetococcales bacterium]MBF0346591.1 H-NS histone family protein [Magnetococcales bacterium]MBF0631150.1 H-NS histone family protein [Magnetococcales bacterium]
MNSLHSSQLENLPLEELVALSEELSGIIKKKRREKSKQIRTQMIELAKVAGFESIEEFMEHQTGRMTRSDKGMKLPPKYRNPQVPDQTWSGKGPTPKWLREYEENGQNREQFRIKNES